MRPVHPAETRGCGEWLYKGSMDGLATVMTAAFACALATGTFLLPGRVTLGKLSAVASAVLCFTFVGLVLIAELKRPR